MIYRAFTTIRYVPTAAAKAAFGPRLGQIAAFAFRAIAKAGKGLELAHLQFRRGTDLVAICSRVNCVGELEIEIDVRNPKLPVVVFTPDEMKAANRQWQELRKKMGRGGATVFHLTP